MRLAKQLIKYFFCLIFCQSIVFMGAFARNSLKKPFKITNIVIDGEEDTRQCVNHAPTFHWSYTDSSENMLVDMIIAQITNSGDSTIWRSNPRPYNSTRFQYICLGALTDGNTYSFSIRAFHPEYEWSSWENIYFTMNTPPETPKILLEKPSVFEDEIMSFPITSAGDLQVPSSELVYNFQITEDLQASGIIFDTLVSGLSGNNLLVTKTLPDNSRFFARIRSGDGVEYSPWCQPVEFYVNRINDPPGRFDLLYPVSGDTLNEIPVLSWNPAVDPDDSLGKGIEKYIVKYSIVPDFKYRVTVERTPSSQTQFLPQNIENHRRYFWKIIAVDKGGLSQSSSQVGSFTLNTGNQNPSPPIVFAPLNGQIMTPESHIIWQFENDQDAADRLSFDLIILDHTSKEPLFIDHLSDSLLKLSRFRLMMDIDLSYNNIVRYSFQRIDLRRLVDGGFYDIQIGISDNWGGRALSARTDAFFQYDDNINTPPKAPVSGFFPDSTIIQTQKPLFRWNPGYDPDVSDQICYSIQISLDSTFNASKYIVLECPYNQTNIRLKTRLLENKQYFWRVRSIDLEESKSDWSRVHSFWIDQFNEPPVGPVNLISPKDLTEVSPNDGFWWENCSDPDPGDSVSYFIEINESSNFYPSAIRYLIPPGQLATRRDSLMLPSENLSSVSLQSIPGKNRLKDNEMYYWRILAVDRSGLTCPPPKTPLRFIYNEKNDPPNRITSGFSPSNGKIIKTQAPLIRWEPAGDPDFSDLQQSISYELEISQSVLFPEGQTLIIPVNAGEPFLQITESLSENTKWFYRVRAIDLHGARSPWSSIISFITNQNPEPPLVVKTGFLPKDSVIVNTPTPLISWIASDDPDPDQTARDLYYIVRYFLTKKPKKYYYSHSERGIPSLQLPNLAEDEYYGYQVAVVDPDGNRSDWSNINYFGVNAIDNPPKSFQLLSPWFYQDSVETDVSFSWSAATDKDLNSKIRYTLFYGTDSLFYTNTNEILITNSNSDTITFSPLGILERQTKYFWKVVAVDNRGHEIWGSNSNKKPFVFTTIGYRKFYGDALRPDRYVLHQNYPNPFNLETTIQYEVPEFGPVEIVIFNVLGKRVKTLASGNHPPGIYETHWNGTDSNGSPVPGGMYLCRMRARSFILHKKILLMK
ncbi:MAG: T9SS type A sorting domain-containing protein [Candidatus Marinimicrobia bacterium]|nr:T9SS type A sorting domain-containing protein [Candidatus Neomarinimicrobiota bacterium]